MSYKNTLTLRYCIALGLVACVLTGSYFVLVRQISLNETDAYTINISGKQRMRSQRIALLAREAELAGSTSQADTYMAKLKPLLAGMKQDHAELHSNLQGTEGAALHALYAGPEGIHARVTEYTDIADKVVAIYESQGLAGLRASGYPEELAALAGNGLLAALDKAVSQYQLQAEQKVQHFKQLETMIFAAGLALLLLEVLLIFRPMVAHIIQKTSALERSNAELTEFAYRISHDLRAPIVSSIGLNRITKKAVEERNFSQAEQALDHIERSLIKLEELVEDVLNLTRMKFSEIEPELVDIATLQKNAASKLAHMPEAEKIVLEADINVSGPVLVKRIYLQQIIENLISNAIKYHDRNKEKPQIHFSARCEGEQCVISVRDNGIGVPESSRAKLFRMFQRLHSDVSFGTGLGLYLVQQNASALGGSASYHPLPDGSEFKVVFPYKHKDAA